MKKLNDPLKCVLLVLFSVWPLSLAFFFYDMLPYVFILEFFWFFIVMFALFGGKK